MSRHSPKLLSIITVLIVFSTIQFGCKKDKGKNIPDVAYINDVPDWVRTEKLLFGKDSATLEKIDSFAVNYPSFYGLYVDQILTLESDSGAFSIDAKKSLGYFLNDKRLRWIKDTSDQIFTNFIPLQKSFEQPFKYYQHYFPHKSQPRIFTLISEFGYFPFIFQDDNGEDGIGISLDMFLGEKFPYREKLGNAPVFSNYLTRTYNKDHMLMRTLEVLVDDTAGEQRGNRLLDIIFHKGKTKYVMSQLMPSTNDSIIMALPGKKIEWLNQNERNIWAHFLHNDLLYEIDFFKINKLVNPSPNAPGLPDEAPGNVGTWLGWQIVKQYMDRYPETSLSGLLNMKNAQTFLEKAKYKPPIQ